MPINNTPRVTGSVNNTTKVGDAETWATITSTWATETRTWLRVASVMDNSARVTGSVNNTPKP